MTQSLPRVIVSITGVQILHFAHNLYLYLLYEGDKSYNYHLLTLPYLSAQQVIWQERLPMAGPQGGREKIPPLNHIAQEPRNVLLVPTKNVQSLNRTTHHDSEPLVWLYGKPDLKGVERVSEDMDTYKNNEATEDKYRSKVKAKT